MTPWTIGIEGTDPKATDWVDCAQRCLRDAKLLLADGSWQNAYMQAGMAVEMAFKGYIMNAQRFNSWPSRQSRPDIYTHNLGKLMEVASLRQVLDREVSSMTDTGLAWMVVKDFDINSRYPTGKQFPKELAQDFVEAVDGLGLVKWLTTGIT